MKAPPFAYIRANSLPEVFGLLATHGDAARLLAQAAPHIAHVAIRNTGTFGGSIAMADPAAEWPACCVALGAAFVIENKPEFRGVRFGEVGAQEVASFAAGVHRSWH